MSGVTIAVLGIMKRHFAAIGFGALMLAGPISSIAAEVLVLSAVGLRQVMLDLGPKFERATGHTLTITFDGTGLVTKRVVAGESVDVVMINQSAIEKLAKDGKLAKSSVTQIARSVTAAAVRRGDAKPDISSPEALGRLLSSAKSVARPPPAAGGSSGVHIAKVLERLGIADEVNAKSVYVFTGQPGQPAESPGDAVAKGKADVALHQLQELMAVPGIEIVGPFPRELQENFTFAAAIGANARQGEAGTALIQFLRTPEAAVVIRAKGMELVAP